MSQEEKKYYLSKFRKKHLIDIINKEKKHIRELGIQITEEMRVGEIRDLLLNIHLNILRKYAKKEGIVYSKERTRSGKPIKRFFGNKFVIDPSTKGGVRSYPVTAEDRKFRSEKMKRMHVEGKIHPPAHNPCETNPKCSQDHASKEEAEFCFEMNKIVENQSCHWQFKVTDGESSIYVDYFLSERIFLEYHPPDYRTNEDSKTYAERRRKFLDKNGFNDLPLVLLTSLNGSEPLEQYLDKVWIVNSIKQIKTLIFELNP